MAKHIEIARTRGPKAGFNAWIEYLEKSGLPQVNAALAEVRAEGNKKAQFDFYCQKFGSKFGKAAVVAADEDDEISALQARIDALKARVTRSSKPTTRSTPRAKATPAVQTEQKNPVFRAWAVRKHNIPTKVGASFTYNGKRRKTAMIVVKVTGKGDALTVECERV